jgi:hypothetical protein
MFTSNLRFASIAAPTSDHVPFLILAAGLWHIVSLSLDSREWFVHRVAKAWIGELYYDDWPNKSLQPTAVGRLSSAIADNHSARRWLSSGR